MDERTFESLETYLQETARHLSYPATPDCSIGAAGRRLTGRANHPRLLRRTAWVAAAVLVILLLAAMATPAVRAAVLEFIQIGVVRIFQAPPAPLPDSPATATPLPAVTASSETTGPGYHPAFTAVAGTAGPGRPTPADLVSILDLQGQTTLEQARAKVNFPLRLPSYPPDLGPPDRVILQDHNGSVVILIWTAPDHPDTPRLSLHLIAPGSWTVEKLKPPVIRETTVNGHPAVWTVGPYFLRLLNGNLEIRRLIDGQVLIWVVDEITYRLEADLPLMEAVRIAESLR